jgi:hypothetical protein
LRSRKQVDGEEDEDEVASVMLFFGDVRFAPAIVMLVASPCPQNIKNVTVYSCQYEQI